MEYSNLSRCDILVHDSHRIFCHRPILSQRHSHYLYFQQQWYRFTHHSFLHHQLAPLLLDLIQSLEHFFILVNLLADQILFDMKAPFNQLI